MFARCSTVRGDPNKIDQVADQVDGEIRAAVEATPGNRGFAVLTDVKGGRLIGASYWDSAESMRASETSLADSRAAAAAAVDGDVTLERFELIVGFRHTIPARGALVRLSRSEIAPARVEEAISLMQEETLPRVKGAAGLCSFQMLIDRQSGSGALVSCWDDQHAAETFWPTAEQLRARASDRVGVRFSPPENYTMVRTTVRLD